MPQELFLAPFLIEYFETSKSSLNFMQNYILKALKNQQIMAICRSLGLISKIITEPYLDRASDESTTALSMGSVYNRLVTVLELCAKHPHLLLKNEISLFFGPFLQLSGVSKKIFFIFIIEFTDRNFNRKIDISTEIKIGKLI